MPTPTEADTFVMVNNLPNVKATVALAEQYFNEGMFLQARQSLLKAAALTNSRHERDMYINKAREIEITTSG